MVMLISLLHLLVHCFHSFFCFRVCLICCPSLAQALRAGALSRAARWRGRAGSSRYTLHSQPTQQQHTLRPLSTTRLAMFSLRLQSYISFFLFIVIIIFFFIRVLEAESPENAVPVYLKALDMFEADEKKLYSLASFRQAAACAAKAKKCCTIPLIQCLIHSSGSTLPLTCLKGYANSLSPMHSNMNGKKFVDFHF